MKRLYVILILSLVLIYGCSRPVQDTVVQDADVDKEPVVQDIDEDIKGLDDLEQDLEDSGLDNIDEELADIDW